MHRVQARVSSSVLLLGFGVGLDPLKVVQRILFAGTVAGIAIGVMAGLALASLTETSAEWWGAVLFVSAVAGLSAGLVLSGANAVFMSRLLRRRGNVFPTDRTRAALATGALAPVASLTSLLPTVGRTGPAFGLSVAIGAAGGCATAAAYRWALSDSSS